LLKIQLCTSLLRVFNYPLSDSEAKYSAAASSNELASSDEEIFFNAVLG
jgi:hypothetical protein